MAEMWTIGKLLTWATDWLKKQGSGSARLDAQLLLGHVCQLDKVHLYVQFDRPLGQTELTQFRALVKRRAGGEPVAYILGSKEFYGRDFQVNSDVLIPRPETEHLVDCVLDYLKKRPEEAAPPRVVDVGTGSGAIAITIAAEIEDAVVLGIDISAPALEIARKNAEALGVRERVKLTRGDGLEPIKSEQSVDVVVSNPPYLDDALMATLPTSVREYEPHLALYGGADGFDIQRRLFEGAIRVLKPGGLLAVELAGTEQAQLLTAFWRERGGFDEPETVADYQGHGRVVFARRTE
jgi:release factor glutamine methyltransferase